MYDYHPADSYIHPADLYTQLAVSIVDTALLQCGDVLSLLVAATEWFV